MHSHHLLINGQLVEGEKTFPVINPATEEILAEAPQASIEQLNMAVAAAKAAFRSWSATSYDTRRDMLSALADAIREDAIPLAALLVQEQGKCQAEAAMEVGALEGVIRYYAQSELPTTILEASAERRIEQIRFPLGVVAAITPWNLPLLILSFKLAPCLIAGNTLVVKPAPTTPLTTLRLGALCARIFPPGVVNIVSGHNDLGEALTRHPDIAKVSFTGSTLTGKKVMAAASATLKRLTLELGGNDAAIILRDADPKRIAPQIFQGAFANSGQICFAIKRLYVHQTLYEQMCDELCALADKVVIGDGMAAETTMGPLQNRLQFERALTYLDEAGTRGRILCGGKPLDRKGFFIEPTIVADMPDDSRLVKEEQFSPILPILSFESDDEVITRVNASPYGLGGSIWTPDTAYGQKLAASVESGMVLVNQHISVLPYIPVSGNKESGIGTELGQEGLEEFTRRQIINCAL